MRDNKSDLFLGVTSTKYDAAQVKVCLMAATDMAMDPTEPGTFCCGQLVIGYPVGQQELLVLDSC